MALRAIDLLDAFNRALAPCDAHEPGEFAEPAPLFIIGPPRSGTTLTYQVITQQLQVGYFTAPFGYLYGMPRLLAWGLRRLTRRPEPVFESRHGRIPGFLAPSEHANFWFRWFPRDGSQGQYVAGAAIDVNRYAGLRSDIAAIGRILERPLVFKNVYLSVTAGALAHLFPRARFLVVERDPLLICQSLLRARIARPDPTIWWSVRPPGYHDWLALPLWQQVARQVHATTTIIRRELADHAPGRVIDLPYERLCAEPRQVIADLHRRLESLGYAAYPDWRCPERFDATTTVSLPQTDADRLRNYLAELRADRPS